MSTSTAPFRKPVRALDVACGECGETPAVVGDLCAPCDEHLAAGHADQHVPGCFACDLRTLAIAAGAARGLSGITPPRTLPTSA